LNQMKAVVNAQETLKLQTPHEMHDKVKKLSGRLELARVMKHSFEKEKVERINAENHINTQINNSKKELVEQRREHDHECLMLKGFVKNLEEQLSTHITNVDELKFSQEAKVNKRSIAQKAGANPLRPQSSSGFT